MTTCGDFLCQDPMIWTDCITERVPGILSHHIVGRGGIVSSPKDFGHVMIKRPKFHF